jgi:hypothetical protein
MTTAVRDSTLILFLVVGMFPVHFAYAQKHACTEGEGRHALNEAATLRSWDALYRSYKSHRQCDDGGVGEGYSESIARILVDQWNTLPQFTRLAKIHTEFRAFVIRHVDATLNTDDVKKIRKKAETQCPTGLRSFCIDLAKQANSALREASSSK